MNLNSQSFRTGNRPMHLALASTIVSIAGLSAIVGCKDPQPKATADVNPTTSPSPFSPTTTPTPTPVPEDPRCSDEDNYVCNVPQDLIDLCLSESGDELYNCDGPVWTKRLYDRMAAIQNGEGDPELSDCPAPTLYVNTSAGPLNLRDKPRGGDESSILIAINRGQPVTCKGKVKEDPSWTKVSAGEQEGYMASQFLSTTVPSPLDKTGADAGTPGLCWKIVAENVEDRVWPGSTCADKNNDPTGPAGGVGVGDGTGRFWSDCIADPAKLGEFPTKCICNQVVKTSSTKADCEHKWEPVL